MWKKVKPKPINVATEKIYYYLRDARVSELSRYIKYTHNINGLTFESSEHSLYGSNRFGIDNSVQLLYSNGIAIATLPATIERPLVMKSSKLSNHLGNLLVSITDKKVHKWSASAIYFESESTSISYYYPFGSVI